MHFCITCLDKKLLWPEILIFYATKHVERDALVQTSVHFKTSIMIPRFFAKNMFIKRWQNLVNKKRGEREREREQIQRKQNGTWQRWRWIYFRCFHNDTDSKHALYLLAIMMSNTGPVITFLHIAAAHKTNHVTYINMFRCIYHHL